MKVGADGMLISRNGGVAVKTMPTLAKVVLVSSLPDATLMALDEIAVQCDRGYTLQIKVHGFSRVPVINSRCGNVVHFYTSWKGKITLDSTDLSFDETTASEFKNSGFALATGGRRLAGQTTVHGFKKAFDGAKESGKWTCADIPLPTVSKTNRIQKTTVYSPCHDGCKSKYGGSVYGANLLPHGLVHLSSVFTLPTSVYMKTWSTGLQSDTWRVHITEYPQHPGQKLVWITQRKTNTTTKFQIQRNNSKAQRTHCHDANETELHTEFKSDNDFHFDAQHDDESQFQYLGLVEEHGTMLRHFQKSYKNVANTSDAIAPAPTDYWDDAFTLQPKRIMRGGEIINFDSIDAISDFDIESAVKKLGGLKCKHNERGTHRENMYEIPEMTKLEDVSRTSAGYYQWYLTKYPSESRIKPGLFSYLQRAQDPLSVPDKCNEKCSESMNRLRDSKNRCDRNLENVVLCMKESGDPDCMRVDLTNLLGCDSNHTRKLEQKFPDEHTL